MDFSQYVFGPPYFSWLCRGVLMTLTITTVSGLVAAVFSVLVLRCHISASRSLQGLGIAFVTVFRNLPLLPLLLFLIFGVPGVWRQLVSQPFPQGLELHLLIMGLALNTAAYLVEILRAGVAAIGRQQIEAARTLGVVPRAIRRRLIYPQAVRIVAPALASRLIHNMKNSTLALVVPLPLDMMEVVGQAGRIASQTFSWAEPLIFAAFIHLVLALGLGRLVNEWASNEQARVAGAE